MQPTDGGPVDPTDTPVRRRRPWRTVALAVALVAVVVAGGTVVGYDKWQAHQRAIARQRLVAQQQTYLKTVRAIDGRVAKDVAPTLHVLAALSTPKEGDMLAARDAFADPTAVRAVRREYAALSHATAPMGWAGHQSDLRAALGAVRDALAGMYADRDQADLDYLTTDLQATKGGALYAGIDRWRDSVMSLFVERKEHPPTALSQAAELKVAPTVTSWVFGIDRACIANNLRIAPVLHAIRSGDHSTGTLRRAGADLTRFYRVFVHVPLPAAQAASIRARVINRVHVIGLEGRLLRKEAADIDRLDVSAVKADADRLRTAVGELPLLSSAFRRYHAIGCAGVGSHGGKSVAT